MSFEERVRSSVDQALSSLVKDVVDFAAEERDAASVAARESAFAEAEQAAQARVAEAEARVRATMDDAIATARTEDREVAAREIRRQVEAEVELKRIDGLAMAEDRMKMALADSEARAADALKEAVAAARARERDSEMAGVTRLLESIRGLDGASSLSEVLDALALASAREAARAAVVVLRGERIHGWKMSGFGARDMQPKSIDLALAESGVIGMAIGAARAVTTRDTQSAAAGPGFEVLPADRMGLAVPVIVGGRVVAVIYADGVTLDGHERAVPSGWPEVIEVLARHAGRCLEALTQRAAASPPRVQTPATASGSSAHGAGPAATATPSGAMSQITDGVVEAARRTARLLVSEIRLFHEPAVHEGRRQGNLMTRLAPQIEMARTAYNQQVPAGVRSQTDFFHQELIRTLAGGDATLLGNMA
ncbi:MAG: hypothetical protein Q8O42_07505 [Acidobacteriota bacterium]|nr:hypothetical protein [Acidobacteriota bacterium]